MTEADIPLTWWLNWRRSESYVRGTHPDDLPASEGVVEIAIQFREREQARINVEGDGCVTALDEVESYLDGYENGIADVLAAGLAAPVLSTVCAKCGGATAVPEGMTAQKLREIGRWLGCVKIHKAAETLQTELRAWARALSTQETQ